MSRKDRTVTNGRAAPPASFSEKLSESERQKLQTLRQQEATLWMTMGQKTSDVLALQKQLQELDEARAHVQGAIRQLLIDIQTDRGVPPDGSKGSLSVNPDAGTVVWHPPATSQA